MRTKVLLSLAAFAASAFVASAQSNVYSVNIVGYVNQVFPAGSLVAIANPLDDGTNTLNSALLGVPAKSSASFWNGSGFTASGKGATWSPDVDIPPGKGFFVNSKTAYTNTWVGEVAVGPGESATNALPENQLVLVGSPIPFAGTLNTAEIGLLGVPAKSSASFWNGSGYTASGKGATAWSPDLPINVGDGFFLNSKTAYDWVQTLPAN